MKNIIVFFCLAQKVKDYQMDKEGEIRKFEFQKA